jgi:hypothetical protein
MADSVLQIIKSDDIVASVGTLEEVTAALLGARLGRYVVEESSMAGELLPSGFSCQRWGVAIRQADGSVILEPAPARMTRPATRSRDSVRRSPLVLEHPGACSST